MQWNFVAKQGVKEELRVDSMFVTAKPRIIIETVEFKNALITRSRLALILSNLTLKP